MIGKRIDKIDIGEEASFSKTISEFDIYSFAGVVGDFNPVHINKEYAKQTMFGDRIAHGILCAGLISTVIAAYLPGEGTIYLSQSTKFLKPVYIGDTITATVKVWEIEKERNRVKLRTCCVNQKGEIVIQGESVVMPPK